MWAKEFWTPAYSHAVAPSVQLENVDLGNSTKFQVSVENGGMSSEKGCQITMAWSNTLPDRRDTSHSTWEKIRIRLSNDSGYEKSEMFLGEMGKKIRVTGELSNQDDVDLVYSQSKMTFTPYEVKFVSFYIYGKEPTFFTRRAQYGKYFVMPEKGKYQLEIFLVNDDGEKLLAQYPDIMVQ